MGFPVFGDGEWLRAGSWEYSRVAVALGVGDGRGAAEDCGALRVRGEWRF